MKQGVFTIILAALLTSPALAAETVTPVEIWFSGDDGLTQKLVDALRHAVAKDPRFRLAPAYTDGAFKIRIPTHVRWKSSPSGVDITASAEFSRKGTALGQTVVACNDKTFNVCANDIVTAAKNALDGGTPSP